MYTKPSHINAPNQRKAHNFNPNPQRNRTPNLYQSQSSLIESITPVIGQRNRTPNQIEKNQESESYQREPKRVPYKPTNMT